MIKIDNSPGKGVDPTVEVEYSDSESPVITTTKSITQPHSTVAGQRTQSTSGHDELWWDEDLDDIPLTSTEPDGADSHIDEILSDQQDDDGEFHDSQEHGEFIEDGQFEDIDGYHGNRIGHESQGDTDEWEDCETEEFFGTQSSDNSLPQGQKSPLRSYLSPEDDLKIKILNPDAPVFTPTSPLSPLSPEMMKTPEGHVKVPNWAEEMKTPTTAKNISFSSASPGSNENSPSIEGKSNAEKQNKSDMSNKKIEKENKGETEVMKSEEKVTSTAGAVSSKDSNKVSGISDSLKDQMQDSLVSSEEKILEKNEEGGEEESVSESKMAKSAVDSSTADIKSDKLTNKTNGDIADPGDKAEPQKGPVGITSDPSLEPGNKVVSETEQVMSVDDKEEEGSDKQSESKEAKGEYNKIQ